MNPTRPPMLARRSRDLRAALSGHLPSRKATGIWSWRFTLRSWRSEGMLGWAVGTNALDMACNALLTSSSTVRLAAPGPSKVHCPVGSGEGGRTSNPGCSSGQRSVWCFSTRAVVR